MSLYAVQNDALPQTLRVSPLPKATEERADELLSAPAFSTASLNRRSNRISSMTDLSDGAPVEWFDAEDHFGEEFLLEDPAPEGEKARLVSQSGHSSLHDCGSASSDEDCIPLPTARNDTSLEVRQVVRRTHLPSGPVGDEGSLFAMLKKNVGKVCFTYLPV